MAEEGVPVAEKPIFQRIVARDQAFLKENRIKTKVLGKESISINKETVDLRYVEQLVDTEQLSALVLIVKYMKLHCFDGKQTLGQAVERLYTAIEQKGFAAFCDGGIAGNLVIPRKQEIYETLNRCRGLLRIQ